MSKPKDAAEVLAEALAEALDTDVDQVVDEAPLLSAALAARGYRS